MFGHGNLYLQDLQGVNRGDNGGVAIDYLFFYEERKFQIRVASTLADTGALSIDRYGAADDQVNFFDLVQGDGSPMFGCSLD